MSSARSREGRAEAQLAPAVPTRDARLRAGDLDPGRVRRVVGLYLGAAIVWIVVSGVVVEDVADRLGMAATDLEIAKGVLFVLVTAGVLHQSLRRWAIRLQSAARTEQDAAERMRHAEDMRSTFLTGISHELRTPLTAIIGFSETIECRSAALSGVQLTDISQRLATNAHRLETLVVDLIEVDRLLQGLGHLKAIPVDLTALARRVAAPYDGPGGVTVVGVPVEVVVDVAKCERLVDHLLDNASRHTPAGTRVTLEVTADDRAAWIVVEDDGPGVPAAIRGDLFEPFVQDPGVAGRPSPGLGIGLTLVAQYAALHGGAASVENRDEGGARFTIRLPRTPGSDPVTP